MVVDIVLRPPIKCCIRKREKPETLSSRQSLSRHMIRYGRPSIAHSYMGDNMEDHMNTCLNESIRAGDNNYQWLNRRPDRLI